MSNWFRLLASASLAFTVLGQDFVYPQNEETTHLSGNRPVINERIPVYIPSRCPDNMLLYPGDGDKSSWSCDCKAGYVYFPLNETCYQPFKRGPCEEGSYVYLPAGEALPICKENTCPRNDQVPFNGNCYVLGAENQNVCQSGVPLRVNPNTFQLECSQQSRTV